MLSKKDSAIFVSILDYEFQMLPKKILYIANVYRDLQGLYGEIRVWGFQIYKDSMLPAIAVIFKVNTLCGLLIYTLIGPEAEG